MATFRCVMFGHIVYDDTLSWEELLETEKRVTHIVQGALEECGAMHIDFTSLADALLVECVFAEPNRETNRALCGTLIRALGSGLLARFMVVDKQLDSTVFYFLGRGKWQEQPLSVPGPREALSGWMVRQERNMPERRIPPELKVAPRTRKRTLPENIADGALLASNTPDNTPDKTPGSLPELLPQALPAEPTRLAADNRSDAPSPVFEDQQESKAAASSAQSEKKRTKKVEAELGKRRATRSESGKKSEK